jgi:hypothetical protein
MAKKIFYEKQGRRYVPVAEYDSDLIDSFTKGTHLVMAYPGGQSRRYNIDPAYAPMIAAGRVAEDAICDVLRKASDLRPSRETITEGQRKAWKELSKEFGEDAHMLTWPSARDTADAAVKAMIEEAEKLMSNPAVQKAYERFIMICELTKEHNE